jgi:hypothetical protein
MQHKRHASTRKRIKLHYTGDNVPDLDIAGLMEQIIRTVDDIETKPGKTDKSEIFYRLNYIRDIARQVQRNTDVGGWS